MKVFKANTNDWLELSKAWAEHANMSFIYELEDETLFTVFVHGHTVDLSDPDNPSERLLVAILGKGSATMSYNIEEATKDYFMTYFNMLAPHAIQASQLFRAISERVGV